MTRPGLFTYLCGNPVASVGSLAALGWTVYLAAFHDLSYVVVVLVALAAARCWQCASQIGAYNRWQKQWDTMNGAPGGRDLFAAVPWLRWPVILTLWCCAAVASCQILDGIERQIAVVTLGLIFLVLCGYGLFNLLRLLSNQKTNKPAKWADVTPLIGKPAVSADRRMVLSALPDYCRQLFP